ncbi:hypothetical protein QL285_064547 [Trifolium repens]|nr:hypothetical protein QL285_064547 [Trifolium repens]
MRQIRKHFTRPDGSFNYSCYFTEVLGETFSSSELESSDSDDSSSSSSGHSSDCVLISPSSFTGKRRDESLALVAVGSEVMAMEVSSTYQSAKDVAKFRELYDVSGTFNEDDVVLESVNEGEYVTGVPRSEPTSFYMYTRFIEDFHQYFPFTEFQKSMLRVLNVAPTQLSPNSWSFIKAFELVCFGLDISEPSVAVFFSFYHIKSLFPNNVVSLSAQPNRGLFTLYSSNYKNYKEAFVRVRGGEGCRGVMYVDDDTPLFPFHWTTSPRLIRGAVYERLSDFERDSVAYLESLNQMSPRDLLDADRAPAVLEKYLKDMSTLTPAQRVQFLEKARARKAQAEKEKASDKVDVFSQPKISEEERKKRKGGDARTNIQVKTSGPNPAAVRQAANAGGEVKSPAKKKSRTLSRKTRKDVDMTEAHKDLVEIEDPAIEAIPAAEKTIAEASQAGGASPWDPLFDPEAFLARLVDMAGNFARFDTTGSDELMKLALGYELKGLLLNYALASRHKAELSNAKEKAALVEKNLATLEEDVKTAKERCEGDVKALKEKNEEEVAKLTKKHREELAKAKKDHESVVGTKDERIKALAKDNEAALIELATLRQEKAKWESEKDGLEATIGEQYEVGFQLALDQVKVLFPDIDKDFLGKADAMLIIEGDKMVSPAPAEIVQDSPDNETSTKESPDEASPAEE